MRRRLIVPAALVAASAYVLARRTRRAVAPSLPRARARRADDEALATRWAWPDAPAAAPAADVAPTLRAPSWDGHVDPPEWARPRGRATAPLAPDDPIGAPAPAQVDEPEIVETPRSDPEAWVEVEVVEARPVTSAPEDQVEVQVEVGVDDDPPPVSEVPAAADAAPAGEEHDDIADEAWWDEPGPGEVVLDSGPFAFGGWAPQSGATSVMGVTFARRMEAAPAAARIRLEIRSARNVPEGGLVVLADAGFAPDPEGFALMLAAESAGSFLASGRWELLEGAGA